LRISELSRQTGVPVGTIKFYLREHLLPPGTPTGRNQAEYTDVHVRRLRLIRTLTVIGGLDLASVRELLINVDDERVSMPGLFEVVDRALFRDDLATGGGVDGGQARSEVDGLIDRIGWRVEAHAPSRRRLAQVLVALQRLDATCGVDVFAPYAAAADQLAMRELELLSPAAEPAALATRADRAAAIARTVLLEAALVALRRMAEQHHLADRFGA
jgi:DNA-binding transcriptional MerR regulator